MKYYLTLIYISLLLSFPLKTDEHLSLDLQNCIGLNAEKVDSSNPQEALLAISDCLSGFVNDLSVKFEKTKLPSSQSIPNTSFIALGSEDTGSNDNVYYGSIAGNGNTGQYNTGFGVGALSNVTGNTNTAIGYGSLFTNTSGSEIPPQDIYLFIIIVLVQVILLMDLERLTLILQPHIIQLLVMKRL